MNPSNREPQLFDRPRLPEKWWEGPLFWPADVAEKIGGLFRYRFGTWRLYQWVAGACFWVLEKAYPEGRQSHRACFCRYQDAEPSFGRDPALDCDICFGTGEIWLDWEGNVIGNTGMFDDEEEVA